MKLHTMIKQDFFRNYPPGSNSNVWDGNGVVWLQEIVSAIMLQRTYCSLYGDDPSDVKTIKDGFVSFW